MTATAAPPGRACTHCGAPCPPRTVRSGHCQACSSYTRRHPGQLRPLTPRVPLSGPGPCVECGKVVTQRRRGRCARHYFNTRGLAVRCVRCGEHVTRRPEGWCARCAAAATRPRCMDCGAGLRHRTIRRCRRCYAQWREGWRAQPPDRGFRWTAGLGWTPAAGYCRMPEDYPRKPGCGRCTWRGQCAALTGVAA